MSKINTTSLEVTLEDGTAFTAVADQRDMAAWEAHPDNDGMRQLTVVRFLAWSAARRAGQYKGPWKAFNEQDCVQAIDPEVSESDESDGEGEEGLDPGRRTV